MPNHILIVQCSIDDDDGSMAQMAASIEKFKIAQGDTVTRVDLSTLDARGLARYIGCDQVIITGHSRFFEPASRFIAPIRYVCRPLGQRLVGGYTADNIAQFLADVVKNARIKDFMFCCCEVASNVDTHTREDNGARFAPTIDAPSRWDSMVRSYLAKPGGEDQVSLLVWIGVLMRQALRTRAWSGDVILRGLNGVGYIVEDNPEFLSFDQQYYSRFETILKRQKKSKTLKGDDEFRDTYVLDVSKKASAHVLSYKFEVGY